MERLGFGTYGKVYLAEPADEDLELDDEELDENVGRAIKILQVPKDESERQYCLRMNDTREKQVAWMREIVDDILEKVRLQEMLHYEHYGPSVDQYSLGITLYCLMNRGYYPLVV